MLEHFNDIKHTNELLAVTICDCLRLSRIDYLLSILWLVW